MDYNSRLLAIVFVLWFCAFGNHAERIRYDNYHVYSVNATNANQLAMLRQLDGSSDSLIFLDGVHALGKSINIVVAPHKIPDFLQILDKNEIIYELIEKNVQEKLESNNTIAPRSSNYRWTSYHTLEDTYDWMKGLELVYPKLVTVIKVGKTYEGRQILGVKLSHKSGNPGIFIEGGIHAREWIAPATVTYILNQLLTSDNKEIREIAENYDWYFIPHTNPDGYVYTHKKDRMWRKTRSPNGFCYGADPNRNWGFHWREVGASSQPCSDTYAGSRAFSEIETKSLSKFIRTLKDRLVLYLSFHSYSQLFLYPWGHTGELPSNHRDLEKIFDVVKAAVSKRYGTKYTGGNVYDAIYPASGASIDWVYGEIGTKLTFCYELRPSNKNLWNGFILPPEQIIPTGEETLDSIVALIDEAKNLGYF